MPETPETPLTVSVQEKPAGTVYVPVRTGTAYTGESWERGSDPKAVLSEDMPGFLEDCLMLPGGLDRLEELCKYWDTSSDEAVGRQIDETFEAMAVYDTAPGSVPEEPRLPCSTACAAIRPCISKAMQYLHLRLNRQRTAHGRHRSKAAWGMRGARCMRVRTEGQRLGK